MTSLLLVVVALATYEGGIRSGIVSGALLFVYLAYDLSDNSFFDYTHVELERIGSLLFVIPGIIGLVHSLRMRAIQTELERALFLEREQSHQALERRAEELERLVAERTSQLTGSVRSLEELHSQIAHDMRGALIQVLRYAELLKVEHAGHLPPDMENYLARIHANALTMELLISELLKKESKSWQTVARTPLATFVSHGSSS